jgi:hypothetical protein
MLACRKCQWELAVEFGQSAYHDRCIEPSGLIASGRKLDLNVRVFEWW